MQVFWAFVLMGYFCELGEMTRGRFFQFYDKLYKKCDWYLFPIEMQRMLVIFMVDMKPICLQGYGHIRLIRKSFKKVVGLILFYYQKTSSISNHFDDLFHRQSTADFHIY